MSGRDTIFALSTGSLPAAIAVVRISGPGAINALTALSAEVPRPRHATLVALHHQAELLDRAIALRFEAPHTVTGEDVVELHLHGGRAVVAGVLAALAEEEGLRAAEPGEFTRRAFENGRIDLTEAEGLADLLAAESDAQRRAALQLAGGALSRQVEAWTARLLALAAEVEAQLDFSDEGDVEAGLGQVWHDARLALAEEIEGRLARPSAERLRDGVRVVIAGPPNSGKSTLFNAILQREAAITSDIAGTTRDLIEAPISIDGVPLLLIDSAGIRDATDAIEAIGVDRAQRAIVVADIILWQGNPAEAPNRPRTLRVHAKCDLAPSPPLGTDMSLSAKTGKGLGQLLEWIVRIAREILPGEREAAFNGRQRVALAQLAEALRRAGEHDDLLVVAEELRQGRLALDHLTGRAGVEDVLSAVFGRFCIGK